MVINKKKTKVISFSKSRKWAFPPELHFSDGTPIEYVSDTRLAASRRSGQPGPEVVQEHGIHMPEGQTKIMDTGILG